ncbi:MAG: polysaccharide deacetylase family protein [Victivallaceae bacterium]|nr:polysaccharide deacetylase family protein [Victivallaceae bacterium]
MREVVRAGAILVAGLLFAFHANAMAKIDVAKVEHGVLALTFDDRNFSGWRASTPLFAKYHAHASFFVHGDIDDEAAGIMKMLQSDGHTVGLHTRSHHEVPGGFDKFGTDEYVNKHIEVQLNQCRKHGIEVHSMAYPYNSHDERTDARLGGIFEHFRSGRKDMPQAIGVPVAEIPGIRIVGGAGLGSLYHTDPDEVESIIRNAAKNNLFIAFYSHNISETPNNISMSFELLERILRTASECGMLVVGLDELPVK